MNHTDQIISALYLAKTDNRESMLSDLIMNVLYNINEAIPIDEIILFINDTFHLEPIPYELEQCLNTLIDSGKLSFMNDKYSLQESAQSNILQSILRGQRELIKRKATFEQIVKDIFDETVHKEEIDKLWNTFNEYLIECFLTFGRKAIDFFLPYKSDELAVDDGILVTAYKQLNSERLVPILKRIILEYPERLTKSELRYLTLLASRAEKFYSLGIVKEDYEKIKNIQIKDLIILTDTNILYSILNLHIHPENSAIAETIRISKEKQVEVKLMYLPITYSELQNAKDRLEKSIPRENFKVSQIKALINSDKLDPFARQYYENKLEDSNHPHPSEKITYANAILKEKGVLIYNEQFYHLEDEYIDRKIEEYREFQRYFNRLYDMNGYEYRLNKDIYKIEHDVLLRESIKDLKAKYTEENEIKFICLTLDRSLLQFDGYLLKEESEGQHNIVNPNFISPSLFLKKIRPFIPITTNDYRKAFLTSLTAPTFEKEDSKDTVLVQKSMTYFKNLGIDDEETILKLIKQDLFLEEFAKHEANSTSMGFIKSEIANELVKLKSEKKELKDSIQGQKIETDLLIQGQDKEKQIFLKEREDEENKLKASVSEKETAIQSLENRLKTLETENQNERIQRELYEKEFDFEKRLNNWKSDKEEYINNHWRMEIPILRKNAGYFLCIEFLTYLPILITILLNAIPALKAWIQSFGDNQLWIWLSLSVIFVIELSGRSYIFDKERMKDGWKWIFANFSHRTYEGILKNKRESFEKEFIVDKPKPIKN